jgi:hypothetical protein
MRSGGSIRCAARLTGRTKVPKALGQLSYLLQYDTDYLLTFVYWRGGAPVNERMEAESEGLENDAFGAISQFNFQHETTKGDRFMKKLAKPMDKKGKDKKQDTVECYESTLVNDVAY